MRHRTQYVWQRVAEHRACWEAAAAAIGAELVPLSDRVWEVRRSGRQTRIANDLLQLDDPVVLEIAGDKELCYRLAETAGVRTPDHVVFDRGQLEQAWRHVEADGHPFVVKPARGTSAGLGVTLGVRTRADLVSAFATAAVRDRRVIVERMVAGESCRLLFLDGEMIHAVRRRGVSLLPDGISSVASLLAAAGLGHLVNDALTSAFLAAQDLTPASVPPMGPRIVARGVPPSETRRDEVRTVYDEVITDLLSPELIADAARVVAAVGSRWAGVDIVTPDPSRPLSECGAMLEVNTTPGILHHCGPRPDACPVAIRVLERLLLEDA
jgi:cyanophycin synthetase